MTAKRQQIICTRLAASAAEFCALASGPEVACICCPTIELQPFSDAEMVRRIRAGENSYEWLIFTSKAAVEYAMNLLGTRWIQSAKLAAIGSGTAEELATHTKSNILTPTGEHSSEGLLKTMQGYNLYGVAVGIVCAPQGRKSLVGELAQYAAPVDEIYVYRRVPLGRLHPLALELIDAKDTFVTIATSEAIMKSLLAPLNATAQRHVLSQPLVVPGRRLLSSAARLGFERVFRANSAVNQHLWLAAQEALGGKNQEL